MQEIEVKDIADDLLIVNKTTIERLFNEETQNPLILYLFYYKTAKWQQCNPIKATDEYCKKCLHWGEDKLRATKKNLKEMQLIEIIKKTDEKGLVIGWYVKVNYLIDKSRTPETTTPVIQEVDLPPNKILINNSINTYNNKNTNNKEIYKEIIDYLNEVTGKRYRHTDVTIKLIKARLNEGFTVDDFKQVIDKKTKDWKDDPKMKDYIRPQTLFGTKFEGYLNQEEKKKPGFMGYMEEFYGKENDS